MVVTVSEPLLVSREQLDAAIAVVAMVAAEHRLEVAIEAGVYVDPESGSEPPVEMLTVSILREPENFSQAIIQFQRQARRQLRARDLTVPAIPIRITARPSW